jgi:hypothetical protein
MERVTFPANFTRLSTNIYSDYLGFARLTQGKHPVKYILQGCCEEIICAKIFLMENQSRIDRQTWMFEKIEQRKESGTTQKQFCQQQEIALSIFF